MSLSLWKCLRLPWTVQDLLVPVGPKKRTFLWLVMHCLKRYPFLKVSFVGMMI